MSADEKRAFVQLKEHREVMQALEEIKQKADNNHHSWLSDFGANVAGNTAFDGLLYLLSRLKKLL